MSFKSSHPVRPLHDAFEFTNADLSDRTICLQYRLTGGPDPDITFEERLTLPAEIAPPDPADPVVASLLDGLHRSFGVSYYKAAVPGRLVAPPIPAPDAGFWRLLYTEGLGEFYYRNNLDPRGRVDFPEGGESQCVVSKRAASERVLVLAGGGKDSAVAREVVRHAGVAADAFSVGYSPWITCSVKAMGLRHLVVHREIDAKLSALNRQGAWNGHVPISACIAFLAMLVAYTGEYSAVIVANERSADEENLQWNGLSINHQWSKSLTFEQSFQAWCARHWQGAPSYFSILRPLSELRIAEAFAQHDAYFDRFTSCNANFRLNPSAEPARWCGRCPKCVFVQLLLAPFLDDDAIARVFGGDFLGDPNNRPLLEELVGLEGLKPFECVGTPEESRAAFTRLAESGRLNATLAHWYGERLAPALGAADGMWDRARTIGGPHCIPPVWEQRLHAYLGSLRS